MMRPNRMCLTVSRCQCTACGEYFNSTSTFDRHRLGDYAKPGQLKGNRRCLFVSDLLAKGWGRNAAGFWIERAREASTARGGGRNATLPATGVPPVVHQAPHGGGAADV